MLESVCVCVCFPISLWYIYHWKLLSYYQTSGFPYLLLCNLEEAGGGRKKTQQGHVEPH